MVHYSLQYLFEVMWRAWVGEYQSTQKGWLWLGMRLDFEIISCYFSTSFVVDSWNRGCVVVLGFCGWLFWSAWRKFGSLEFFKYYITFVVSWMVSFTQRIHLISSERSFLGQLAVEWFSVHLTHLGWRWQYVLVCSYL